MKGGYLKFGNLLFKSKKLAWNFGTEFSYLQGKLINRSEGQSNIDYFKVKSGNLELFWGPSLKIKNVLISATVNAGASYVFIDEFYTTGFYIAVDEPTSKDRALIPYSTLSASLGYEF
jgi:hypothetical protein